MGRFKTWCRSRRVARGALGSVLVALCHIGCGGTPDGELLVFLEEGSTVVQGDVLRVRTSFIADSGGRFADFEEIEAMSSAPQVARVFPTVLVDQWLVTGAGPGTARITFVAGHAIEEVSITVVGGER